MHRRADTLGYTCSYPKGTIGEQAVDIHGLLASQLSDTTPFYNEPQGNAVFITGNPGPASPTTRRLERDFAAAKANDAYDGNVAENVAQYEADPTVERLCTSSTPTPTERRRSRCSRSPTLPLRRDQRQLRTGTTAANAAATVSSINNGYAWNHGYYAPEVDNTWLGLVGPGVAHSTRDGGVDGSTAGQGPSSAGAANSAPQLDTSLTNSGTWADHTDIRPTLMALTGLRDDYIEDGRVLTEDLTVRPGRTGSPLFIPLAAATSSC